MGSDLAAVVIDAIEPTGASAFWSALLRGQDPGFALQFVQTHRAKIAQNRIHFDLTSRSDTDQQSIVDLAISHGGRHVDVGQHGDEGHVVLADPDGNEFCVIEPGNEFLADTGVIGAINCDGTRQVGTFWASALDWPLVWDQHEETAIQAPSGGVKITWSGPPLMPRLEPDRLRLALRTDDDLDIEIARLVGLGAQLVSAHDHAAVLADPDGNEFTLGEPVG